MNNLLFSNFGVQRGLFTRLVEIKAFIIENDIKIRSADNYEFRLEKIDLMTLPSEDWKMIYDLSVQRRERLKK